MKIRLGNAYKQLNFGDYIDSIGFVTIKRGLLPALSVKITLRAVAGICKTGEES